MEKQHRYRPSGCRLFGCALHQLSIAEAIRKSLPWSKHREWPQAAKSPVQHRWGDYPPRRRSGVGGRTPLLQQTCTFGKGPSLAARTPHTGEIRRSPTHNSPMNKLYYERADHSVVVKNRAPPPKAWRWEIYRAGNVNPIKQSSVYFDTTAAARRAGKEALKDLLNKLFAWSSSGQRRYSSRQATVLLVLGDDLHAWRIIRPRVQNEPASMPDQKMQLGRSDWGFRLSREKLYEALSGPTPQ